MKYRIFMSLRAMYKRHLMTMKGFSLIEVLVGISIVLILTLLAVPSLRTFQTQSILTNGAEELVNVLLLSQSKARASEGNALWGVFFDTSSHPDKYVVFKGASYATRDASQDNVYTLSSTVEVFDIAFNSSNELVFQKSTGVPLPSGSVSLRLISDPSSVKTVVLNSAGIVQIGEFSAASDTSRVKDSRHVHVDYVGRAINTSTESVKLVFVGVTRTIPISTYLNAGKFFWEGDILVQGETQKIKIHTHRLNDPVLGTQFSIHRDKRYNTKSVTVELSGDTTGTVIEYDSTGQTTKGTSLYVSLPSWQ